MQAFGAYTAKRCSMWGCAALLSACAGLPPPGTPARFIDADTLSFRPAASALFPEGDWPPADWWRAFGDATLDGLVEAGLRDSPDLQTIQARGRAARSAVAVAAAAVQPQVSAGASVTRERFSAGSVYPPPLGGSAVTLGQVGLNLEQDLDFWGRHRLALRAVLHEAQVAEAEAAAARAATSCAIAQAWFEWRVAQADADVAGRAMSRRAGILDVTRRRVQSGLDAPLSAAQAAAQVAWAEQRVVSSQTRIQLARHQLSALVGSGPDAPIGPAAAAVASLESTLQRVPLPSHLAVDLIARRADVAAMRARAEAAAARVGVARADFMPRIDLAALVGFESLGLGRLLRGSNATPGITSAIHLPIFDGGALRGRLGVADAEYDAAVEGYNAALVTAVREVADQMSLLRGVADELRHQAQAEIDTELAYEQVRTRYRNGLLPFGELLLAEERLFDAQRARLALQQRRLVATIGLIRALGGGYVAPDPLPQPRRTT